MNRPKIIHYVRNTSISIVVLLVLIVGAGVTYTWYMGQKPVVDVVVDTTNITPPKIKHVESASNVPQSASVQLLTSPVVPGSNASITIKTNPGSICTISVVYDKTTSTDSGLIAKKANDFGVVTWAWTVEPAVPIGKWPVKVTCELDKKMAVVIGDLVVAKSIQ